MKKIISLIILFVMGIAIVPSTSVYATINNSELEDLLVNYFSNELEEKRLLKVIENQYIVPNSKLKKYDDLYSEMIIDWYKGIDVGIQEYSVDVEIISEEYNESIIKLEVDKSVNLKYIGMHEYSSYIDNHIVYLKNINGQLLVQKDIKEDGIKAKEVETEINGDYQKYIEDKINLIISKNYTLSEDIDNFNTLSSNNSKSVFSDKIKNGKITTLGYSSYNGAAAATWARNNAFSTPDYSEDCTNFVSKALRQGGLPTDGTWYQGSNAWIRVIELRDWLINKGYATEYSWQSNSREGDIVQLYKSGYTNVYGWQHSLMITYINPYGKVFVSSHSSPKMNVGIWDYYPTSTWSNIRFLKITTY